MNKTELGLRLENIVKYAHNFKEEDMCGLMGRYNLLSNPFDAALIALSPICGEINKQELNDFIEKWEQKFRIEKNYNDSDIEQYSNELETIILNFKG